MKRLGFGLLFGFGGAIAAAVSGYFLIMQLSANAHDRSLEAAMTGVFVCAPLGALAGAVLGVLLAGRRQRSPQSNHPL